MLAWTHLFPIIFACLVIFWYHNYQTREFQHTPEVPNVSLSVSASSKVLQQTFSRLSNDFERVLGNPNYWKLLKSHRNVSVETYDGGKGLWPVYVRTTMVINRPVSDVYKLFTYENFAKTQSYIDPFYESSTQINIDRKKSDKIINKISKCPLFYRKRLFTLAVLERKQLNDFDVIFPISGIGVSSLQKNKQVFHKNKPNNYVVPKGTPVIAMFSVNNTSINNTDHNYFEAKQQFIVWFIATDDKMSTHLEILMRVDLGLDIPRWLFIQTVGVTGIWAMNKLPKLL